jgi:hypothetical protein
LTHVLAKFFSAKHISLSVLRQNGERETANEFPLSLRKDTGAERKVKVERAANSKIPSMFDYMVCNSSTIKSNYQEKLKEEEMMYDVLVLSVCST